MTGVLGLDAGSYKNSFSTKTYSKYYEQLAYGWEETAIKEKGITGKHEAQLHLEQGDIDENGILLWQ
ncbi:hypothetical protein PR048_011651 [Dryococelus australis]|uniref:Uncharacterized protein n=1 Tax=Dryococelus australis TaxID=614101 RepID=A0ABQ9HM73_9NEOP|nr:hypothetical protein PR048_011651 [Dryococelus australis]